MVRHLVLCFLLVSVAITVSAPVTGDMFTESGLVDMPTGRVLKHGVFGVGTSLAFERQTLHEGVMSLGDAVAIRFDFGLFDRVEVGFSRLSLRDPDGTGYFSARLKAQLLKEQEAGAIPNVAIGIESLGDQILPWKADETPSTFLVVSKTFNLPRIHQFSGHIGVGTQRFAADERPIGLFVGVSKEFQPAFARGDIRMHLAFDGVDVNAGVRYIAPSGLQVALGAETLNAPDEFRYLAAVSWTNAQLLEQIDETRRLLQRATKLAVEARRAVAEKEGGSE